MHTVAGSDECIHLVMPMDMCRIFVKTTPELQQQELVVKTTCYFDEVH